MHLCPTRTCTRLACGLGQPAEVREHNSATLARATTMSYTLNAAAWVLRPVTQMMRDGSGNRLNESRYYYDGNTTLGGLGDATFYQAVDAAGNTARDYRAQYDDGLMKSHSVARPALDATRPGGVPADPTPARIPRFARLTRTTC